MIRYLTRLAAIAVVLVSAVVGTASAGTHTSTTTVVNGTGHWIYVDTMHAAHGTFQEFIPSGASKLITVTEDHPFTLFVDIYVKAERYLGSVTYCHLSYNQGVTAKPGEAGTNGATRYIVLYPFGKGCSLHKAY